MSAASSDDQQQHVRKASRASSATSTSTWSRRSAAPKRSKVSPSYSPEYVKGCRIAAILSVSDTVNADEPPTVRRDSFVLLSPEDSQLSTRALWSMLREPGTKAHPRIWLWELRELVAHFRQDDRCAEIMIRETAFVRNSPDTNKRKRKRTALERTILSSISDLEQVYAVYDGWPNLYVALETHHAPQTIDLESIRGISQAGVQSFASLHALAWQAPVTVGICTGTAATLKRDSYSVLVGSAIVDNTSISRRKCIIDIWLSRLDGVLAWPNRYARLPSEDSAAAATVAAESPLARRKKRKKRHHHHTCHPQIYPLPPRTPPRELDIQNMMLCA